MKTNNKQNIKAIILGLVIAIGAGYVSAWTGPTAPPTGGNVPAPINVGGRDGTDETKWYTQTKSGILNLAHLITNDLQITTGTPAEGKILKSDSTGIASWVNPSDLNLGSGGTSTSTTALSSTGHGGLISSVIGVACLQNNLGAMMANQTIQNSYCYNGGDRTSRIAIPTGATYAIIRGVTGYTMNVNPSARASYGHSNVLYNSTIDLVNKTNSGALFEANTLQPTGSSFVVDDMNSFWANKDLSIDNGNIGVKMNIDGNDFVVDKIITTIPNVQYGYFNDNFAFQISFYGGSSNISNSSVAKGTIGGGCYLTSANYSGNRTYTDWGNSTSCTCPSGYTKQTIAGSDIPDNTTTIYASGYLCIAN